jgi:hypothetical protein
MIPDSPKLTAADEPAASVTTDEEQPFSIKVEDPPIHIRLAPYGQGKGIAASGIRTRPTWTISTVVMVGLILIGAATVGAIIRDVIYLDMLESKQKSQIREMQGRFPGFGR